MADHHLAQLNVARLLAPTDSPIVADFMANLEPVNALAEAAPGFVWRIQTEAGDATSVRVDDDDLIIVNMSLWESAERLHDYAYRSDHRLVLARRKEWFEPAVKSHLVLWWVGVGHLPSVEEVMGRLALLRSSGPSADAFTFNAPFPPPG
jgi:hypothetical protein